MKDSRPPGIVLAILAGAAAACLGPTVPSVPLETLLSAPEQITVGGRVLTLETYLWRDFMPGGPAGGTDLMAAVLVTAEDQQPYPAGLDADKLWVINGEEVWEADLPGQGDPPSQARLDQLQEYARGGPPWETGIEVEVVVRVAPAFGPRQLLRASAQTIHRTD
jgi:hypothetical protein